MGKVIKRNGRIFKILGLFVGFLLYCLGVIFFYLENKETQKELKMVQSQQSSIILLLSGKYVAYRGEMGEDISLRVPVLLQKYKK